ncbi:Cdc6/Cdc18 family protein [Natranaeroarchaeum aerophilus]|uniref:AAA family ATPase n=1 Tax=Natranaeroarchaeum aerophilus TaxID=2917711 RepID=A0AAE3FSA2_9EURY|nr:AAA family ATPase [Natranaeroarchaeum aerophilus]MCL9813993.1 AAA family ATPase [Natranaeroarchaeum aerophilus]
MDLSERIARRQQTTAAQSVITQESALNPAVHLPEPIGRGAILERLLDALGPVFEGSIPENVAVCGPGGAGKSAIVTSLFSHLNESFTETSGSIGTTTRSGSAAPAAQFAYVNTRQIDSAFQFYHAILDTVSSEPVPRRGIGTDELAERLEATIQGTRPVVIAVDHIEEGGLSVDEATELLEPVEASVCLLVIHNDGISDWSGEVVDVPRYQTHALVDLLAERASYGLASGTVSHEVAREVASWADGDAHDALAALFGAAIHAQESEHDHITSDDVTAGMEAVPEDCIQIGRVLALPDNRRNVLLELLSVGPEAATISEVAAEIGRRIDLSPNTVQRFVYELAETGILERTVINRSSSDGRRPTTVVPRFPTLVFQRLEARR